MKEGLNTETRVLYQENPRVRISENAMFLLENAIKVILGHYARLFCHRRIGDG